MPTLAAYPGMMQRARKREGLRVCRAAWLVGVSVGEYREIEAGDRMPSLRTYERAAELYGWPERFEGRGEEWLTRTGVGHRCGIFRAWGNGSWVAGRPKPPTPVSPAQ
jgi:transcriptional regulator with XRE-family HTH domain